MMLKRKKITTGKKVKIVQEMERNPIVLQIEIDKCLGLPPLLNSIVLQKASVLEEEGQCEDFTK